MSTRGSVGTLDNVLISGFIVGDVGSATVVVRALGPSLASLRCKPPAKRPRADNLRFERNCYRHQRQLARQY